MRRTILTLGTAGLLLLAVLSACNLRQEPLQQGEHVTPQLAGDLHWTAGQPGQLGVRLVARGQGDSGTRILDFSGLPGDVNPVATVTFYRGTQAQPPVEVALDHRC